MNVQIEPSDREFLGQLHRLGASRIQQLCAAMGVTATAIRQRISRLETAGFVDRETVRGERGRPYHVYRVTGVGLRQLGDDYSEFAHILWRQLQEIEDADVRQRLIDRIRDSLVSRYRPEKAATAIEDRFEQLRSALSQQGFDVEVETRIRDDGLLPVLREHHCPYQDLAADDASICELEQSVFEEVLGVPMALTQCCRDGHACCEFEAVTAG